jgi:CRP-like cAMP-binding protein
MASPELSSSLAGNLLLAALPPDERARLSPSIEEVDLALKEPLYRDGQPITHVYFPHNGVVSMLQLVENAEPVEVATVGREGMVGVPVFLGATTTTGSAVCQIAGRASRLAVPDFQRLVQPGTVLHDLLHRYLQALLVFMAQNAACNRRHTVDQRCARWLVMTADRVNGETFLLTQEFLAQMLGIRRAGVSEVASQLQKDGLIRYARGRIEILDRPRLEARSCDCYLIIRGAFERMLQAN